MSKLSSLLPLLALLAPTAARAQTACPTLPTDHISRFTSVAPGPQTQQLRLPATHTFQLLAQGGDAYSNPADGQLRDSFDFTGFVAAGGSASNGYIALNHEGTTAAASGVSILDLNFSAGSRLWSVVARNPVNFAPVVGAFNNCSGGLTPWNTVVTCEENTPTSPTDSNGDGYYDFGWATEIDPATRTIKDQDGDGRPDKLWHLGRFKHENVTVAADQRTVYQGADEGATYSFVYKFVATTAGQLGAGRLYVLKLDGAIGTATTGTWLPVPNTTPAECNSTATAALALGATSFNGVEDTDISPLTGQVYFAAKGPGTVYRFTDAGSTVSGFEVFVGNSAATPGQSYPITTGSGTVPELWGLGNDNLTFDAYGNLYVLQDGGRNHIWLVRACHTQAAPAVEVFALTPAGGEPTGMTFSPDQRFLFLSFQHPSAANTLAAPDAAGQSVVFNKASAVVIGRKGTLGALATAATPGRPTPARPEVYPNPATGPTLTVALPHDRTETATLLVYNSLGTLMLSQPAALRPGPNQLSVAVAQLGRGVYQLVVRTEASTAWRAFSRM
ncbi:hypothetical protein SAMN02745146_1968 [Hymenobacter daecheongensis DSM 21074]|uniref:Por secretion system C-terminal sorting domain-containing protein n=1 Tax=Hymenobacter daecheongensis DSM 21074 TaxID=1121955 RepID=A0A1M6F7W4_9BACT|nr:alkaline phosphatase PhoX [Hymenobacter daecheongensis]SHI93808.1 hypothetical protein SAMN02745146_1968 [Hymenobacter daecheongensis DSM 21074]